VVAEGIEDEQQYKMLREMGYYGHYFSHPVAAADFATLALTRTGRNK
jgi:EAL domain-containing protein (putative c-di-GMP-specific phosphodiesterase class I)